MQTHTHTHEHTHKHMHTQTHMCFTCIRIAMYTQIYIDLVDKSIISRNYIRMYMHRPEKSGMCWPAAAGLVHAWFKNLKLPS